MRSHSISGMKYFTVLTVYAEKADRSKILNVFLPVIHTAMKFFFWRKHGGGVVHTKNHRLKTKTLCLAALYIADGFPHFPAQQQDGSGEEKVSENLHKGH